MTFSKAAVKSDNPLPVLAAVFTTGTPVKADSFLSSIEIPFFSASSARFKHSTQRGINSMTCKAKGRWRSKAEASTTTATASASPKARKSRAQASSAPAEKRE